MVTGLRLFVVGELVTGMGKGWAPFKFAAYFAGTATFLSG